MRARRAREDGNRPDYYRAHYYHPRLQRFISGDPMGIAGGINQYVSAYHSPVEWIDPIGFEVSLWG